MNGNFRDQNFDWEFRIPVNLDFLCWNIGLWFFISFLIILKTLIGNTSISYNPFLEIGMQFLKRTARQ